tara:strand:- start:141 stop:392 length:252 start_codon:yes stop_codon:yes gene_type:complete
MREKSKKLIWRRRLLIGVLLSASVLGVGCKTPVKLDNTRTLISVNPQGFSDAVGSSPSGKKFVEDALGVIIDLEYEIERGGNK